MAANPTASADAKAILNWLAALPDRPDKRVFSGQYISGRIGEATPQGFYSCVEMLYDLSGKWLGMIGVDYGLGCTPSEISTGNQTLIAHWNDGGLVTIVYHVNNPWTGGDSWDLTSRCWVIWRTLLCGIVRFLMRVSSRLRFTSMAMSSKPCRDLLLGNLGQRASHSEWMFKGSQTPAGSKRDICSDTALF